MGASLVNSLYEYMMILEEEDRKKQLKKVSKIKRAKKDSETANRIKSPKANLAKSTNQSKTALQTIERRKQKRVKRHHTTKPSTTSVVDQASI